MRASQLSIIFEKEVGGFIRARHLLGLIMVYLKEVAIDSRLSTAKVHWNQPAVSSKLSLVTFS